MTGPPIYYEIATVVCLLVVIWMIMYLQRRTHQSLEKQLKQRITEILHDKCNLLTKLTKMELLMQEYEDILNRSQENLRSSLQGSRDLGDVLKDVDKQRDQRSAEINALRLALLEQRKNIQAVKDTVRLMDNNSIEKAAREQHDHGDAKVPPITKSADVKSQDQMLDSVLVKTTSQEKDSTDLQVQVQKLRDQNSLLKKDNEHLKKKLSQTDSLHRQTVFTLTSALKNITINAHELKICKKQTSDLKEELLVTSSNYKKEVEILQDKIQEISIKARAAEHTLTMERRQLTVLRQKMIEYATCKAQKQRQEKTPIQKQTNTPRQAEASTAARPSAEENHHKKSSKATSTGQCIRLAGLKRLFWRSNKSTKTQSITSPVQKPTVPEMVSSYGSAPPRVYYRPPDYCVNRNTLSLDTPETPTTVATWPITVTPQLMERCRQSDY